LTEHQLDIDEFSGLADEATELNITLESLPTVVRRDVTTPEGMVSALSWGDTEPEIVLLHGVALNAHTWDATLLAFGRPALAIDLPGHGRSEWRADATYGPRLIAQSLATVVAELAPHARAIVGHSLGGLTALALCEAAPDLVRELILIDIAPMSKAQRSAAAPVVTFLDGPTSFASRDEIVERAEAHGFGRSRESLERAVVLNTVIRDDGRVVWRHEIGQHPDRVTWLADTSDLWLPFETATVPTTLVRAARGFVDAAHLAEVRERVPKVTVVEVATGHNVQEDDPLGLAHLLTTLLK